MSFQADEDMCPVCRLPGHTCTSSGWDPASLVLVPVFVDPLADEARTFTVAGDVFEDVAFPGNTSRAMRRLVVRKGARVTPEEARRLGLLPTEEQPA